MGAVTGTITAPSQCGCACYDSGRTLVFAGFIEDAAMENAATEDAAMKGARAFGAGF